MSQTLPPHIAQKKNERIVEYLLHIYQSEDLMRMFAFKLDDVSKHIVENLPLEAEQKEQMYHYYADLIEQMEAEKLEKQGHLQHANELLDQLLEIHQQQMSEDEQYVNQYLQIMPHFSAAKQLSSNQYDDVRLAINGLYGLLLLRLQNKPVPPEWMPRLEAYGQWLAILEKKYHQK